MKKILLLSLFSFGAFYIANAQLYANFEDISPTLTAFDGSYVPAVVENPLQDDVNPSDFVFGGASSAIGYEGAWFATDDFLDFTNSQTFTMLVYGSVAGKALLKLESLDNTAKATEILVDYLVPEVWQELSFVFPEATESGIYNKIVVFMDMNSTVADNMFYWDYLIGPDGYENGVSRLENKPGNVFPNPFNDELQVNSSTTIKEISLINMVGQNVISLKNVNSNSVKFETSGLKNGIYFMKLNDVEGAISTAKLIKK
jgi:hypothetical protein